MFSENKDNERRSSDRQKDGNHYSFIRHRIPYRLLGRRSLGAKRLVVSSKVLFPAIPTQNCDVVLTFPANTEDATLMWLLARLKSRAPSLTVHVRHHSHTGIYGFYLTALYESLLQGAEELGILKPLKPEYGGGMKEFVYEDQDCFVDVWDEASFLTSQERQSIVLHFLHELRATGDDSLEGIVFIEGQPIVPLLITKKVVSQVFPLHNHADLKVLRRTWVQAVFSRQPLDTVCSYFGVKIALYFAYLGHYTVWLILPALVGLVIFFLQGHSQWHEDISYVGFALFNTVWATLYLKFWKRRSTEFCYRWGTVEQKDEMLKDPRPLFKGDLVKNPITGQQELAYSSWKRLLFRYFITFPVIAVCLAVVFIVMLLCFELQEWVNELISDEELPYMFSFVPKVLLAVVVSIFDEIYKQIALWLTQKENYRLQESHETNLVIKLVLFQFVNSFLSLFYIGFYLRDMDRLRDQLAALLITRQVLGNIKESLVPYVIWKARLYSVGLRIATRMSPASVEKEVRRMTTHPNLRATSPGSKNSKSDGKEKATSGKDKNSDSESSPVTEEDDERLPTLTQAEVESAMKTYEDTLDDYLEMCIQFGYITLFSSAFPLAAVCALMNNVIEIRSDAFKICFTYQRPFGQRVENIGIWQDVLLVMSVVAVIVNCALVTTSGLLERVIPGLNTITYCLLMVLIEHVIIMCKFALYRSIPDLPPVVATEMARLEYQRSEALKQLVSQMAPNSAGANMASPYQGSPIMRRKRLDSSAEAASTGPSGSSSRSGSSSPVVITSASIVAQRPSDIFLESCLTKPAIPPRFSLQKSEPGLIQASSSSSSYGAVADKVVAAALNPLFDSLDKRSIPPSNSSSESSSKSASSSSTVSSRFSLHEVRGSSEVPRRAFRNRLDLDMWRRRSEPVSSAVKEAVGLHLKDKDDDSGLKKKSIYENKEDLRENLQDGIRKSREKLNLRQEIMRSRDRLNALDNIQEGQSHVKDESIPRSSSAPRVSAPALASLPPATPAKLTSSSTTTGKYSVSPRVLRVGIQGDSKILSRKSRSLSSTDVNEIRQAFRDRFSWRGEPSLIRSASSLKSDHKKDEADAGKDNIQSSAGGSELERITTSLKTEGGFCNSDGGSGVSESRQAQHGDSQGVPESMHTQHEGLGVPKSRQTLHGGTDTATCSDSISPLGMSVREDDGEADNRSTAPATSDSEQKLNRAIREHASKPLSVSSSRNLDHKDKNA